MLFLSSGSAYDPIIIKNDEDPWIAGASIGIRARLSGLATLLQMFDEIGDYEDDDGDVAPGGEDSEVVHEIILLAIVAWRGSRWES